MLECVRITVQNCNNHHRSCTHPILNTLDLNAIPSRCCVPTKYKKINMVFYNEANDEHIIKQNVPAQATDCDCL